MMPRFGAAVVLGLALGCRSAPPPPQGTGAKEAALEFFQAVAGQDWDRAYTTLSTPSKQRFSQPQFATRAKDYHRHLGFEPKEVKLSACDETGAEALAHVTLIGESKRYRDGLALQREDAGWKVNLPATFGQKRR